MRQSSSSNSKQQHPAGQWASDGGMQSSSGSTGVGTVVPKRDPTAGAQHFSAPPQHSDRGHKQLPLAGAFPPPRPHHNLLIARYVCMKLSAAIKPWGERGHRHRAQQKTKPSVPPSGPNPEPPAQHPPASSQPGLQLPAPAAAV